MTPASIRALRSAPPVIVPPSSCLAAPARRARGTEASKSAAKPPADAAALAGPRSRAAPGPLARRIARLEPAPWPSTRPRPRFTPAASRGPEAHVERTYRLLVAGLAAALLFRFPHGLADPPRSL